MKIKNKKRDPMPPPEATPEEIGKFWDTHSLADYWDETHEVKFQVTLNIQKQKDIMRDTIRFGDFVEINPRIQLEKGREYPYVEMADVSPGNAFVFPEKQRTYKGGGSRFQAGDTLFARITPCLENGKIVRLKNTGNQPCFGSTEFFVFRGKPNVSDPTYIFYLALSPTIRDPAVKSMTGASGRQRAILSSVENILIPLLPLSTQRKIAAILSAYDDLIENNTRRIKILEDMAQTLYREWFVHFLFPGHADVPMVESPLGPIPEGWKVKNFGEVSLNFDRQRKPLSGKVRSTMQGEYPYYGAAKVLDHINDYLFDGRYLLIGEDGSVVTEHGKPVLQLVTGKFWVNNHTHVVQGKAPISTNFLYLFMSNVVISGHVTGTAQPKINQQNLNRIPVISPPQSVLEKFNQMIEPNFNNIVALNLKNVNLQQTRDLLLPKLISGEIDVSKLDIETDPKSN
ncbi:MAG: restriction endonuclease subunit S [Candidatus Poribacteria bacterium]|nr:restriction endonuclease subunit S [Candidatus Poribacteria bacterium]